MVRPALLVSTMAVAFALGCGGRESGTGTRMSSGSAPSSGTATGNGSGSITTASGTVSGVGSGASSGPSWSDLPLCPVPAFQSTLVWAATCYPAAASPEGTACSGATTACRFCSFVECSGVPDQSHSPRQFYSCSCVNGQQQCSLVDQDAGICAPAEAGVPQAGAKVPLHHRATAATCPMQRGPGTSNPAACSGPPPASPYCCVDSDCDDAGTNGRCIDLGHAGQQCTHDACFTDSNCRLGAPCICRSSPSDNSANICALGSNCAVDADCGAGGYCSPSTLPSSCGAPGPFYCHTATDTCINDSDCFGDGSVALFCTYDPQVRHWACSSENCPP